MMGSAIAPDDFRLVRDLLYRQAGLVLDAGKEYLVEARLSSLARRLGMELKALFGELRLAPRAELRQLVVEAMTIHETSFFRDWKPFEALRSGVLPKVIAARTPMRELNIWCAACASGQEPYSIAMILRDAFPQTASWRVRLLATDVSNEILAKAQEGRYSQIEVNRGLPANLLIKHMERAGPHWVVKPEIRKMVEFRQLNLTNPWPAMPPVDLLFIRNVLIYFDLPTKREIFSRCRKVMRRDGYLFLGSGETTLNLTEEFERAPLEGACCYQPTEGRK